MAEVTQMRNNALPYPIYACAFTIVAPLLDADGDPVSPSSPDSEVSKNGDTFADCTNEMTEIATSSGVVYLTITATEMTADIVTLRLQSTGAKTTIITLYPRKLPILSTGTCQGSSGTSDIQLASGDSAIDDYYSGCLCVAVIDGTTEARIINDYVGSTRTGSVSPAWNTAQPDNNDTYTVYLPEGRLVQQANTTHVNSVSASSVTTINANLGQTQPVNFTGTGASALIKSDMVDIAGAAVSTSTAQIGVNVIQAAGTAWASGAITAASIASNALTAAKIATDAIGAAQLAADAVTEIQSGLSTLTQTQVTGGAYSVQSASCVLGDARVAHLDADVSSRMATYTQPVGFLAATFPGTVASTTNITTATGIAVSSIGANVITATSIAANAITAAKIATDAIGAAQLAADAVAEIQSGLSTYAGGDTSGTTTLLSRLSATRAGYLDNLSAGAVALASGVTVTTNNDKTGYSVAAAGLDAVVVETGLNARQALSIIAASTAGVLSGAATTTVTVLGAGVATTRISATVDSDGDRSAITLSPPA